VSRQLTGLVRDRASSRDRDLSECRFELSGYAVSEPTLLQPVTRIYRQPKFPSCAGECCAGRISGINGGPPYASGVSIWRDARRRQGLIEEITRGTRLEYALESLAMRGWDPYREDEEYDEEEAGLGAPPAGDDLFDEMRAAEHRGGPALTRYRISEIELLDGIDAALHTGLAVVGGWGLREAFFHVRGDPSQPDVVLDTEHISGDDNGHGMGIFGRAMVEGERRYLVQNSHDEDWGGCHLPEGRWQPGCCWVKERAIRTAWDVHAFVVVG
jgi:hypothetical protein